MSIRFFGARHLSVARKDPVRLAGKARRAAPVDVVGSRVRSNDDGFSIAEPEIESTDPYNSTGRFLAEKIRTT